MFIRVTNGNPTPYTMRQLRRDNPQTSFPKDIPAEILVSFDVHPVKVTPPPQIDSNTHLLTQDVQLIDDEWRRVWQEVELPQDQVEDNIRFRRDGLLQETDWMALSDVTMTGEMTAYRQALRDIPAQAGFPNTVTWPTEPEG